jgi:hypothetical protein
MLEICEDTVGDRPRASPCFLVAGDLVGNAPIGSLLLFSPEVYPLFCKHC